MTMFEHVFQNQTDGVRKPFSLCRVGTLRSLSLSWSLSIFTYFSTFLFTFLHACMLIMIPEATTVRCPFTTQRHFLLDLPIAGCLQPCFRQPGLICPAFERVVRTEVLLKFSAHFPPWFLVTLYFTPWDLIHDIKGIHREFSSLHSRTHVAGFRRAVGQQLP